MKTKVLKQEYERLKKYPCSNCCDPAPCKSMCENFDEWWIQVVPFIHSPLLEEAIKFYMLMHTPPFRDIDKYYEDDVCEHDFVKQVEVMKNGKILLRCTECPYLFVQDSLDSKPREPTAEDFQSLHRKASEEK